jgi:hypothetical protein
MLWPFVSLSLKVLTTVSLLAAPLAPVALADGDTDAQSGVSALTETSSSSPTDDESAHSDDTDQSGTPDPEETSTDPAEFGESTVTPPPGSSDSVATREFEATSMPTAQPTNGIPALSISLDDGMTLAEIHRNKELEKSASLSLVDPDDSSRDLSATGVEFKGRGNSTWTLFQKKPYQIKFEDKTAVLGMSKAKKWGSSQLRV